LPFHAELLGMNIVFEDAPTAVTFTESTPP